MFKPAVRSQTRIKLAISGPSGSGKTQGALLIAQGLGAKKIAVGDSENGSASLYAKEFKFDTVMIAPPYSTEKFISVIQEAVKQKYDCLILDTISHAWVGEGGILDQKNAVDDKGGNSYTNWNKFTPKQQKFIGTILNADIDMIVTMRSKQDYVLEKNDKGKMVPQKVGMAPQQREGMEYEFTTVFDVMMNHETTVSKDRTKIFDGKVFKITEKTGQLIRKWLDGAEVDAPSILRDNPVTEEASAFRESMKSLPVAEVSAKSLWDACDILASKIDSEETKAAAMQSMIDAGENVEELKEILERLREITGG